MTGLIFVGMVGPESHNKEEQRFVEELSAAFATSYYLRGAGIKGLRLHQVMSIRGRLASRRGSHRVKLNQGSLFVVPFRSLARGLNVRWIAHQLVKLMNTTPVEWTVWIRFPSPELVEALANIPAVRVVYEPIDLYSAADDLSSKESAALQAAEAVLMRRATVITGGRQLADQFRKAAGGSHWLPFGTDCKQSSVGFGLDPKIPKPRIVVVGCLDSRVDESLLASIVAQHPGWHLVLVGPRVRPWGRRLEQCANVHWLGRIPVEQVRPVIRECDVTLIPYLLTGWTRHCLPVKVFEYLAEGKPVIATQLPELTLLADAVTISPVDRFDHAIQFALQQDTPAAQDLRRRAANRFTLQDRARSAIALMQARDPMAATH